MKTAVSLIITTALMVTASTANIQPLILGGKEVPAGTKTYVVGLRDTAAGESFCGGSLITPTHVLTAAHCAGIKWVSVGTHFLSGKKDGEQIKVKKETPHPLHNGETYSHDYLILELAKPSNFTPVAIATKDVSAYIGEQATVMGWGATTQDGQSSKPLLRVDVAVRSDEDCASLSLSQKIDNSMFCAGGKAKKDSCQGDSGGPIVIERETGGDLLIGSVSWGDGCGIKNQPGVYTRPSQVVSWIRENAPGVQFAE